MSRRVQTVFVSATYADLIEHRAKVLSALLKANFLPLSMEYFGASGQPPIELCFGQLNEADVYVGIVGFRYGSSPAGRKKSYTHLEYEYAKQENIPTLIFLMEEPDGSRAEQNDAGETAIRLQRFKRIVLKQNTCQRFTSPDDLATAVLASVTKELGAPAFHSDEPRTRADSKEIIDSFNAFSGSLLDWPRTLVNKRWIDRDEQTVIHSRLSSCDRSITVLLGPPGSGKSALLSQLAHQASDDGWPFLAIKADFLPIEVESRESLAHAVGVADRIEKCIAAVSPERPFLLLVDQLDALSDLMDLRSGRLNALLELVRRCRQLPRVHIICSCREFEFRHDVRLNSLAAERLELKLPSWEQVNAELFHEGITDSTHWPANFRAILQTPQHLDIFLRSHKETGRATVFASYQHMLDDLWDRKLSADAKKSVVYDLAEWLTDSEQLWAPIVHFEDRQNLVKLLVADGILEQHQSRIGFRHQTMLEHAKARLFTKPSKAVVEYVLPRQDALFVRPTVWATLTYLRETYPSKYQSELETLFGAGLRLHMRYLLIEFLGQLTDPREFEVELMARALLVPDDRMRVLIAVRGKKAWFTALRSGHFPNVMNWPITELWPMVGVVCEAWRFAPTECFDLLDRYFLPDPEKDYLTYRCLHDLPSWDQAAVERACKIIGRTGPGRTWWAEDLVSVISKSSPELAPKAAAVAFENELRHLTLDAPSPLEDGREWHELPTVARCAPVAFLREMWPWFVEVVKRFHSGVGSSVLNQFGGGTIALDTENDRTAHHPAALAIETALLDTAKKEPATFLTTTMDAWSVALEPIQLLVTRGFTAAAAALSSSALDFLCSDPRRFNLGCYRRGDQFYSRELINAIAPHLDPAGLDRLLKAIGEWSQYRDHSGIKDDDRQCWDREARLRLLSAVPTEHLSVELRGFIATEKAELPGWDRDRPTGRGGRVRVVPPISKDQMPEVPDEAILRSLKEPAGQDFFGEWSKTEGIWVRPGGRAAAIDEIRDFSKQHPDRCLALLPKVVASGDQEAAAEIFAGVGKSDVSDDRLFGAVLQFSPANPTSSFRSTVAYVLHERCRPKIGLPDDVLDLLERWLAMPWSYAESEASRARHGRQDEEVRSVIWINDTGLVDADQAFWVLEAASLGLLIREPADIDRWLSMIEEHIERPACERAWRGFAHHLRFLELASCDKLRVARVLEKLFTRHPAARDSQEGARLISNVWQLLPPEFLKSELAALRVSESRKGAQVYGELLTLIALAGDSQAWAFGELWTCLTGNGPENDIAAEDIRIGIGFSAAHLWEDPSARPESGRLLAALFPTASERVCHACSSLFWASQDFPADEVTESVLNAVAQNTEKLSDWAVSDLVAFLPPLLPYQRQAVLRLTKALLTHAGNKLNSVSTALYHCGAVFVDIAMTLQRFPETRAEGLELIEQMLRLGLDDAFSCLTEIDLRPASAIRREPMPRRRRRRVS